MGLEGGGCELVARRQRTRKADGLALIGYGDVVVHKGAHRCQARSGVIPRRRRTRVGGGRVAQPQVGCRDGAQQAAAHRAARDDDPGELAVASSEAILVGVATRTELELGASLLDRRADRVKLERVAGAQVGMLRGQAQEVAVLARALDEVEAAREHAAVELERPEARALGQQPPDGGEQETFEALVHVLVALALGDRPLAAQLEQRVQGRSDRRRILDQARDSAHFQQASPLAPLRVALLGAEARFEAPHVTGQREKGLQAQVVGRRPQRAGGAQQPAP